MRLCICHSSRVWRKNATWHVHGRARQCLRRKSNNARLTLLCTAEERAVFFEGKVNLDEVRAREELHDHAGGDDGGDTEFHESAAVRGENDTHPVERVGGVRGHDAVERDLGADEEDEESDGGP